MTTREFGINLSRIRAAKGLSAYELSLRLNKDASYVHKVENAKINPSLQTILDIAKVLEISPKELFEYGE
ncbi:MAG: helix-turn-helix domain-containing protein [Clostridiales bacterium]|jgi:transcriptional regulator with XRE-family HTH domain|nr:helix-turn-helix transcriptional regulator [Clostridium sp.]MCI6945986.1 helix-turn-helix domain-containing protein [Clostridiales bacterium]MDY4209095.1 helix-turn-helix transcriptional regulator [Eubacteriales bacterium]MEE0399693.1 helix-turn-helix transcriptional regulator [Christensenellales bacterium]CDD09838.1 putative uncharacterized protein [Clostridium sp. CAG:349]